MLILPLVLGAFSFLKLVDDLDVCIGQLESQFIQQKSNKLYHSRVPILMILSVFSINCVHF